MSLLHRAKEVCSAAGFIFGLVAAYFWFKASTAKVTDKDNGYDPGVELSYEDPDNKGNDIRVVATAMKQSKLNKIAAIYTGLAILFQAAASIISSD
jgi:hypothetical protein